MNKKLEVKDIAIICEVVVVDVRFRNARNLGADPA